jgi:hypothetical protein
MLCANEDSTVNGKYICCSVACEVRGTTSIYGLNVCGPRRMLKHVKWQECTGNILLVFAGWRGY